ncbi:MAG: response regulator [Cytophagales bacterium]|nr:response regulator [Cytophagales bacterium]
MKKVLSIFKGFEGAFLLIFIHSTILFSQSKTTSFHHLSVKDGLSQNSVMSIFKDSKGYMWFGTRDGLNRYDGYEFTIYRHDALDSNSISSNFIGSITEDQDGIIWIGTNDGLNAYDRINEKFTVFKFNPTDNSSISSNNILSLIIRKNGDLWIGTENGLNHKPKGSHTFQRHYSMIHNPNSLSDHYVFALYEDDEENLWIGTRSGGLNKLSKNSSKFIRFTHDPSDTKSLGSNFVRAITKYNDEIWIGTAEDGIDVMGKNGEFRHIRHLEGSENSLSNNIIRAFVFDDSNLWIATFNGLNCLNTKNGKIEVYKNATDKPKSVSHNSIRSLYLDERGFLWAGTYFGGLNILNPTTKQFRHYKHNPYFKNTISYNVVGDMVEDKAGNIWIGTEGGGLNYFNYSEQSFRQMDSFYGKKIKGSTIKSLLIDSDQNLWIGTHRQGLVFLDISKKQVREFYPEANNENSLSGISVLSLIEDHSGKIWIGSNEGLNLYDPTTSLIKRVHLKKHYNPIEIISLFQDSQYNIWVGTKSYGLMLYEHGTIKHYIHDPKNPKSISHNSIYEVFEDSKNQIWIGTYGGGLNQFHKEDESFSSYKVKDGLVNDIVYSVEEDDQKKLWISTPGGISKFDPESIQFKNYTPNNGLPITEFNEGSSLKHSNGTIFIGGVNGLLSFDPNSIRDNPITPEVLLTELKLFNKPVNPNDKSKLLTKHISETDQITFSHSQNIFTIEFIAINYSQPGENQYAYMLEGLETEWNYVGDKRFATYTNLSAGNYTFKVKAANNDGIWSEKMVSLNIVKIPPFWQTTWAYIIYSLLGTIVFFVIRKYFLIKLNLENKLKLEKLEKQQLEDLTKLKLRFFTNISHDFRTPLTLIHAPLQELIVKFANTNAQSQLLLIRKNVNLMLRLINQLMDFRKLENNKLFLQLSNEPLVPFIKEVALSFKDHARIHNIRYSFSTKVADTKFWFDKDKLEKILYNLLSNAFKNTLEDGTVSVEIAQQTLRSGKGFVKICIRNTGHGIEKEHLESIFDRFYQGSDQYEYHQQGSGIGLSLVKNLVELHKGYIKVQSEIDQFTEFIVGIPMEDVYSKEEKTSIKPDPDPEKNIGPSTIKSDKNKDSKKDHTVLIVEDNHDLRNYLAHIFFAEYNVITAENGEVGLSKVKEHHIDIVISDIMMPKLSGIDLCKKLKLNPKTKHIPVILLTARTATSVELDSYDIGADDFISKPFNIEVLKSKVKNFINSRISINNYARHEVLLDESEIHIDSADEQFLEKLSSYIRDNISNPELNVNKISDELGLSRVHLYRKVKSITGKSPVEFMRDFRLSAAAKLLEQDNYNINEVCFKTGFQEASYFRKCFKKKFGIPASQYTSRFREEDINA